MKRATCLLALLGLLGFQSASGQVHEIRKLVMTGDDVPGITAVTEQFAYFGAVHIFEDGQVGFNGVTTRTGSVFRNSPRGIYLSTASGGLSVVAEINDEEAWRSIGVPHRVMDSDSSKTFAFNYLNPTETSLEPVFAKKELGHPTQNFNPDDGSFMLVSHKNLPPDTFYQGNFSFIYGGIMLNPAGDVLASADFAFTNDPGHDRNGLFLGSATYDVRNVVFEGDAAPGFTDATFSALGSPILADNGNIFFTSTLSGSDVTSASNQTLWMEDDGQFTLLLREGDDAPMLPGKKIRLTGVNLLPIGYRGEHIVFVGGASTPGGTLRRVFWHAGTDGAHIRPMVQYYSSPTLTEPDYFTATDRGQVAFTSIDGNSILVTDDGDVYFQGVGRYADDSIIGGIWKYDQATMTVTMLVESRFGAGQVSVLNLLAANNRGSVAFVGRQDNVRGVWVGTASAKPTNLAKEGDQVEGRTITGFAFTSSSEAGATLGTPKKMTQLNDRGDLVFVAFFDDTPDDDDTRRDEAIMLAVVPPPGDRFLWSGDADDDDWHKVLNWDDEESGLDADRVPGNLEGTDTDEAIIINASVVLSGGPIHLGSLVSTGSLAIEQPLVIEKHSDAEHVTLRADLTINGELALTGQSEWLQGSIQGAGMVAVPSGAELVIAPTLGDSDLHTLLRVEGDVSQGSGTLNLQGDAGKVEILFGGAYSVETGSITDATQGVHVLNDGQFIKSAAGVFTLDAFFENGRGGSVDVDAGTLRLVDPSNWEGEMRVQPGAVVEFQNTQVNLGSTGPSGAFAALGDGILRITDSFVDISGDTESLFQLVGDPGKLEIGGTTAISGAGKLINAGNAVFSGTSLSAPLINDGIWDNTAGAIQGGIENNGIFTFGGGRLEGLIKNTQDLLLHNGTVVGTLENTGGCSVEQGSEGPPLDLSGMAVDNRAGGIITFFGGSPSIPSIVNHGTLILRDATLEIGSGPFENAGKLEGTGTIGATMINASVVSPGQSAGRLSIDGDYSQLGGATLDIEIGGMQPGSEHDQLVVQGAATAGGTLRVSVASGFLPPTGTRFQIVQAGSSFGAFDNVIIDSSSARQNLDVQIETDGIWIEVSYAQPATFQEWQSLVFSTDQLADPEISGRNANPEGDRFTNAVEYVLDLRPTIVDQDPIQINLVRPGRGKPESVTVTLPRANGMTDAELNIVESDGLSGWSAIPHLTELVNDEGPRSRITMRAAHDAGARNSAYFNLIVLVAPDVVDPEDP